jgi:hypothetical protein
LKTNLRVLSACVVGAIAVSGCGASSGTGSPAPPKIVSPGANVLQLAVGTANIYGTGAGVNVVTTYRQPKGAPAPGDSGALVSSPTLSIPSGFPAAAGVSGPAIGADPLATIVTGPALTEIPAAPTGAGSMTATAQAPPEPINTTTTTFGQAGGAFGLGIEPFNYTSASGTPFAVNPYPVPLYDVLAGSPPPTFSSLTGDPNQLPAAWGGVPAFDILGTGQAPNGSGIVPAGTAGISAGLNVFEIPPAANVPYSLTVTIAGSSSGTFTKTASAQMTSTALLPTMTSPTYTPDATGNGGLFGITLPAGVTEAYLEVVDFGVVDPTGAPLPNCNGASLGAPIFYTFEATASGTFTMTDTMGPGGAQSICAAADNTTVNGAPTPPDIVYTWAIGFDYPAYEASYPNSKGNPAPTILGASGQSDITISPAGITNPPPTPAPSAGLRHNRGLHFKHR